MTLEALTLSFPWARYSRKLKERIERPQNSGIFTEQDAVAQGARLAKGSDGSSADGNEIRFYLLVNPENGVILDARFQVYGQSALIGAAEIACDLLIHKNYDQAKRFTADLIDKQVRDKSNAPAFPTETYGHLNLAISAIIEATEQCEGLPLAESYTAPPMPTDDTSLFEGDGYPGFNELSHDQKLAIIEQVIEDEIRPYIALDAGGIEVIELSEGPSLLIRYQGSCTACYSSVGATLSAIQQILRAKVHPNITVTPDFDKAPTGAPPRMASSGIGWN